MALGGNKSPGAQASGEQCTGPRTARGPGPWGWGGDPAALRWGGCWYKGLGFQLLRAAWLFLPLGRAGCSVPTRCPGGQVGRGLQAGPLPWSLDVRRLRTHLCPGSGQVSEALGGRGGVSPGPVGRNDLPGAGTGQLDSHKQLRSCSLAAGNLSRLRVSSSLGTYLGGGEASSLSHLTDTELGLVAAANLEMDRLATD